MAHPHRTIWNDEPIEGVMLDPGDVDAPATDGGQVETRSYEETVAYAVARMNERAVHREGLGWKPDINYVDSLGELASACELIGYAYRVDADTVIEDIRKAAAGYDGPVAGLRAPDFLKGGE
ncbi:MAG TPA: hypothetical protein DCP91_01680 [Eggerthellaceae bacterium]|nr:hypothetical protein [Eggerthellaceae bacterium]